MKRTQAFLVLIFVNISFSAAMAGTKLYFQTGQYSLQDLQEVQATPRVRAPLPFAARATAISAASDRAPRTFVVQFLTVITTEDQDYLKDLGVEVLRYVPDDAYVVRGSLEQMRKAKQERPTVHGFVEYAPQFRLSPALPMRSVFNRDMTQALRLHLFSKNDMQSVLAQLAASRVQVEAVEGTTIFVQVLTRDLATVSAIEGIEWISKKPQMKLMAYEFSDLESFATTMESEGDMTQLTGYESGTRIMGFQKTWDRGLRGGNQVVAVADTGLDTGDKATLAADFANHQASFMLGYGSYTWADSVGHGTHVAGSVGGVGALSEKRIRGGAVEARIVAQSLWSPYIGGLTTPDDLGTLFQQAYDAGARIHTNSWGDPSSNGAYNVETAQVDKFVWENPDMLILFAAGNDGVDADRDGRIDAGAISAPSTAKNVISVGASENLVHQGGVQRRLGEVGKSEEQKPWPVEPLASDTLSNNPNGLAAFSSRGPTADGRLKPDLVAPGTNILSNCSHMPEAKVMWGKFNKDYCFSGGTSMATPLAAGAAAIVRERLQKLAQFNQPSAALVKAVMLHTTIDLYPGQYGEVGRANGQEILTPGPNSDQGYGLLHIDRAVTARLQLTDNKVGAATGEALNYEFEPGTSKVTLVYNDAPASPTAARALVNDLDLEVHVGGKVFTSTSRLDNSEQVVVPDDFAGAVNVIVRGVSVPMGKNGKQPFALIASKASP